MIPSKMSISMFLMFSLVLIANNPIETSVGPQSTTTASSISIFPSTTRKPTISPTTSMSIYEKTKLWMHRFNARFLSLMRPCLQRGSSCQCLSDLDHLARLVNVTELLSNKTIDSGSNNKLKRPPANLRLNDRRKMAVILLTNIIRLDAFQERKHLEWYRCTLDAESICPNRNNKNFSVNHGLGYYEENRGKLLELLMPDIVQNKTIISPSIYSFEFVQNLDSLLRRLNRNVISLSKALISHPNKIQSWFGRENLLNDLDRLNDGDHLIKIETLALLIVNRLVRGENIELFESRFLRDIIERYGKAPESPHSTRASLDDEEEDSQETRPSTTIDQQGLIKLLNDLHIGGLIESNDHDDGDDEDGDHRGLRSLSLYTPHNHRIIKMPKQNQTINDLDQNESKLFPTILKPSGDKVKPSKNEVTCLDYTFYLNRLNQKHSNKNLNDNYVMTADDIQQLAPIFLQQIVSKACERLETSSHDDHDHDHEHHENLQKSMMSNHFYMENLTTKSIDAIIYAHIAVLLISLSSLMGMLLIPFLKTRTFALAINALIGLAYGSMSGDALFHLIPAVLSLHSHDDKPEHSRHRRHDDNSTESPHHYHHDYQNKQESHEYLWLMLAILASIYFLFLFEVISNALAKLKDKMKNKQKDSSNDDHGHENYHHHRKMDHQLNHQQKHVHHGHQFLDHNNVSTLSLQSNDGEQQSPQQQQPAMFVLPAGGLNKVEDNKKSTCTLVSSTSATMLTSSDETLLKNLSPKPSETIVCFGMTSLALIITLSDSIHNLLDGVAIGISFSSSISRGLSTSIAVFCHELPHEFGDFAVMISTGMTVRRATMLNFLSALTAFIGLYIGLGLGSSEQANRWALAVCAGLFLYISICDMLSELKEMTEPIFSQQWFLSFFMKNFGILLGYVCMVLLALYEEQINFA